MNDEKYFVVMDCNTPDRIYFDKRGAFDAKYHYIDSFNEFGIYVQSYELNESGNGYKKKK